MPRPREDTSVSAVRGCWGEDVAAAVVYLEENDYVTGIDLPVNGGFSIC